MTRTLQYFWRRFQTRAEARYEDFIIQIQPSQSDTFPVEVLKSPAGVGAGSFKIPAEDSENISYGEILFRAIFQDRVQNLYQQSLGILSQQHRRLRIRLRINSAEQGLAEIADLPWESLTDPNMRQDLSLSSDYSVVRDMLSNKYQLPVEFPTFLQILVVIANPRGSSPLNFTEEREKIQKACAGRPVAVDFLEAPTRISVRQKLLELKESRRGVHVLHFIGHGEWNQKTGEGQIVLEQGNGDPDPVEGKALADILSGFRTLRLVVLNSCSTARGSFSSVASKLLFYGFPAVLAMRSRISDQAAIKFGGTFYERLASGASVEDSLREGRLAIGLIHGFEWATPVLFLPTPRKSSLWRRVAAAAAVSIIPLLIFSIFGVPKPAPDLPPHPRPIVGIDLPDHATVPSELLVSGDAREQDWLYYIFVRDLNTRQCYVQNQEPLQSSQDGKWRALARFSGSPGQAFQLLAVAVPHPLERAEWKNCGAGVPRLQSADRSVYLGPVAQGSR